nr:unnamed protein product [Spirometra erinaceieuropaei]
MPQPSSGFPKLKANCSQFCVEYFIELLLTGAESSPAEVVIFCAQEAPSNRREILVQMQSVLGPNYVLFTHATNGSLDTSVFLHRDLIWYISVPQCSGICTRSAVQTKGAVALSFILFGTSIAVINAHFKANERNFNQRLQDYNKILEDFDLPKPGFTSGYRHKCANPMDRFDHVFWVGDLNFRVKKTRAEVDQLLACPNAARHVKSLLEADELRTAMQTGQIFEGFEEGEISFLPTFKFDINSDSYDSSEKQRVPSYTDRILYRSKRNEDVTCITYDSITKVRCSDHRPVYAIFAVSLKPGRDNIALSAGAFHREIYIEGNRRRALQFDLAPKKAPLQKNKGCSIQ